jgi:hypothetical protein
VRIGIERWELEAEDKSVSCLVRFSYFFAAVSKEVVSD